MVRALFYMRGLPKWIIVYTMKFRKTLVLASMALLVSGLVSGQDIADYDGNLQVEINNPADVMPGEELDVTFSPSNRDKRPVANGYIVVNIVSGGEPYYPSQSSNDDRTPVSGLPFVYSTPKYDTFTVSGSGSFPQLDISRTETVFSGTDEEVGTWNKDANLFESNEWPTLRGPIGVFTRPSMDTVSGEVVIENHGSSSESATVDITVCEWDDTACSNLVDTYSKTVTVSSSGTTVPVEVDNPDRPGAYAVKMEISSGGETHSIYRNRIIREGNTSRIRKMTVNRPYIESGDDLSVGLVAGASADHYTSPSAVGVDAQVRVETMEGEEIMDKTKTITRLSDANVFQSLYFNTTARQTLTEFRVIGELSADGEVFDSYSYVVDYSEFDNEIENVSLRSYSFGNQSLSLDLCAETRSGAPAVGDVQGILSQNYTIYATNEKALNGCGTMNLEGVDRDDYDLRVNYGEQSSFNISSQGMERKSTGEGGLPVVPIAVAVVVLLAVIGAVYVRGDSE